MEHKIYCFWLNADGKMSSNRQASLENLKQLTECEVILVTKDTLENYILPDYPLHESFNYLSEVHKTNYLTIYIMHHYGGGFSDIKKTLGSWKPFFNELYNNDNLYCVGYRERKATNAARLEDCILNPKDSKFSLDYTTENEVWDSIHIKMNWRHLIGNGAYICKPNTPFTLDLWNFMHEKLDGYLEKLKQNPAKWPRDCRNCINPETGETSRYPLPWTGVHGNIFHPLTLKYKDNISKNLHHPIVVNYQ